MGLFGKSKYEKGGLVRGSIQMATGTCEYTAGVAKEAADGHSSKTTGLKAKGARDMIKGTKKMLGIPVKKE